MGVHESQGKSVGRDLTRATGLEPSASDRFAIRYSLLFVTLLDIQYTHTLSECVRAFVMTNPVQWLDKTFSSRERTQELLQPDLESGLLSQHDYQAAVMLYSGTHRYWPVRIAFNIHSLNYQLNAQVLIHRRLVLL